MTTDHIYYDNFLKRLAKNQSVSQKEKEEWAIVGACELVGKLMKKREDNHFFGFWKRVSKTEKQAILVTHILDEQALLLGNANLCVHWTRVRLIIKERLYL